MGGEQHHRPAARRGIVAVLRRDGVGVQPEQHVAAAVECGRITERGLGQLGAVGSPRGDAGGLDHQAGVVLFCRQHPDRERRRVSRDGVGDPVAGRVDVHPADSTAVRQRAKAHRAGQPFTPRCGKRLDDNIFHVVTAADAGGLHRVRQRAVEAESDVAGISMGFRGVGRGGIDVDQHVVVLPAQVGHRRVPAQHRERFAQPGRQRAVNLLACSRI